MKQLWTPWRMKYIMQNKSNEGCVLCEAVKAADDESFILYHGEFAYVMLNRYPYNNGHLMIIPYAHIPSLEEVQPETRMEMMELLSQCVEVLKSCYQPQGINLGANIGEAAGAGIAEHLHFHVLPRWAGDTNFMSSVGETRIIPERLDVTWQRLRQQANQLGYWKTE